MGFKTHKMLNCISTNNGSKVVVKSLLDSSTGFSQPRNKLVIYDDDPHKEAALREAKKRHEEYLRSQKQRSDYET